MLKDFNENNLMIALIHGYFINEFTKETQKEIKQKKQKKVYYKTIRQQIQFGEKLDITFIKNKQNYLSEMRERLDKFSPDNLIKFIESDTMKHRYVNELPEVIVDVNGIIAAKHEEINSIYTNIITMFYINPVFLDYINESIKDAVNSTDVPYKKKYFVVGLHNAEKFFSSIIYAYNVIYPEKCKELISEYGYNMCWQIINSAILCYQYRTLYIESNELIKKYMEAFVNHYFSFDEEITEYTNPYRINQN